ncbi:Transglutaminase-like enzyme, putative cysteine protease [Nakamurella panacisegetis]|uniref:Transglutaminase-like enzyme, putative cysteine protease n=1 Tax=Nakamurella panacisegetis TaxID=1090615 RepID=A0A1H0INQ4_9ACTN|nr:transglutaminase family protein [Nakamurella panacisegetis]SDO32995.1 Transglutaminase-like enzyme, putative cysteine protease [Nakamurella panacisegetis]
MTAISENAYGPDIWRLLIVHRTELTYPDTVTTSYNEFRMQPSDEPGQAVLSSRIEIDPFEGVTSYLDYFGTRVASFDVHRPHRHLTVTATSTVETFPSTAFGAGGYGAGVADPERLTWEQLAASGAHDRYEEFLTPTHLTELDDELNGLSEQIRSEAADPSAAGRAVCSLLTKSLRYEQGATGVHTSAAEAWSEKRGVCQDFSHLAIGMLRAMGVPTRYVSGYLHPDRDAEIGKTVVGQSHAWVEWFDGMWVPFDPTNASAPGHSHVVVGRGRDYRDVPPVKGVYAGPEASGNEVTVRVTRLR